jgi:hypothetical protein
MSAGTSKPGWVVVQMIPLSKGGGYVYCGHKHLSFAAAGKCFRSWLREVPGANLRVVRSR